MCVCNQGARTRVPRPPVVAVSCAVLPHSVQCPVPDCVLRKRGSGCGAASCVQRGADGADCVLLDSRARAACRRSYRYADDSETNEPGPPFFLPSCSPALARGNTMANIETIARWCQHPIPNDEHRRSRASTGAAPAAVETRFCQSSGWSARGGHGRVRAASSPAPWRRRRRRRRRRQEVACCCAKPAGASRPTPP